MDTAKSLRDRARQWRSLAGGQHPGTADALIEAACELEVRASRLEQALRTTSAFAGTPSGEPAPSAAPRTTSRR
jgi:hypothetical protein